MNYNLVQNPVVRILARMAHNLNDHTIAPILPLGPIQGAGIDL